MYEHSLPVTATTRLSRRITTMGWRWLLPLLLLLLGGIVCLHRLGEQSLWLDEGYAAGYVTGSHVGRLLLDLFSPAQAYPLYHLLLKLTTRLLGDSEWALRLPSALAGAFAVPALYALGCELRDRWLGLVAALLLLGSPFAIWQAQDAKAYSLTLLATILLWWTCVRALRVGTRRTWRWFALTAVCAPFVHRLTLLPLLGCAAAIATLLPGRSRRWRVVLGGGVVLAAIALTAGISVSLQRQGANGQFIATGPFRALQLTATKFALDRFGCDAAGHCDLARRWFMPFGLLLVAGLVWGGVQLRRGTSAMRRAALFVLLLGGVPLLVFLVLFALQPLFEPRYLIVIFPAWLLLLANGATGWTGIGHCARLQGVYLGAAALLLLWVFVGDRVVLIQPTRGLWSGAAVKEDYKHAVKKLAEHVHPDDLVIVHPDAIKPLYDYYARRVSQQPLPAARTYPQLGRASGYDLREFDIVIRRELSSVKRAWLLIAPDHARVVDPPRYPGDELGLVGLAFQYGDRNGRIQCGDPQGYRFNGVRLYCNNIPDPNGIVLQPAQTASADFGGLLRLRGVTIMPFAGGPKPGGTLPVSLFWEPLQSLAGTNFQIFIHLTKVDDPTVLAQTDGPPMEGGQPTSRWTKSHDLLHDDRSVPLPANLAPGNYVLRVGVYTLDAGAPRLPVTQTSLPIHENSVIVAPVEIRPR
ncbi:MAG: glycosyltransferase family 39 protein [Herpetosiphonaceae bacterium]|nr:glycosyltransferase family 39 protein [Herpetosiphonaceae bacterium]